MPASGFGRGSVNIQNLGKLLEVKNSDKFKNMIARMPCLIAIAQMNSELEVSQLIDVVNGLKIANKDLIIHMETLNATLLRKKAINFNVKIHHMEPGESVSGQIQSWRYFWGQSIIGKLRNIAEICPSHISHNSKQCG